jgi:hypothetical protein
MQTNSPFVYSCPYPIFVQVYRPLPPCGNPIAVNKYQIYHITIIKNNGDPKTSLPSPAIHDVPKYEHNLGVMTYKIIRPILLEETKLTDG